METTLHVHFRYTAGALLFDLGISTALAMFACKRKQLMVYFSFCYLFAYRLLDLAAWNQEAYMYILSQDLSTFPIWKSGLGELPQKIFKMYLPNSAFCGSFHLIMDKLTAA